MPYLSHIECDKCRMNVSTSVLHGSFVYQLDRGHTLSVHRDFVWCKDCEDITAGEILPSQEDVERNANETDSKLKLADSYWTHLFRALRGVRQEYWTIAHACNDAKEAQTALKWREVRTSPPRCLTCGSTKITHLELTEDTLSEFQHPECGGLFRFVKSNVHVKYSNIRKANYTPEGIKIKEVSALCRSCPSFLDPDDDLDEDGGEFSHAMPTKLYEIAVDFVLCERRCSVGFLERRLRIGSNQALSLLEFMERDGVVGPDTGNGKRKILKELSPAPRMECSNNNDEEFDEIEEECGQEDLIIEEPVMQEPQKMLDEETLYEKTLQLVQGQSRTSSSYISRKLNVDEWRAEIQLERLFCNGIVGPCNIRGARKVLATNKVDRMDGERKSVSII